MSQYLRTDTAHDLVETLELANEFFLQSQFDARYWKWFIHALHSAAQSTAALALENGNGYLVQKPTTMQRMLQADADNSLPIEPHMDNFLRLIKKSLDKSNLRDSVTPLEDRGHIAALESLDELRDEFAHFNVKSWSIEFGLILECATLAASFIEHYTVHTPAILWHDKSQRQRAEIAAGRLQNQIAEQSATHKDGN